MYDVPSSRMKRGIRKQRGHFRETYFAKLPLQALFRYSMNYKGGGGVKTIQKRSMWFMDSPLPSSRMKSVGLRKGHNNKKVSHYFFQRVFICHYSLL